MNKFISKEKIVEKILTIMKNQLSLSFDEEMPDIENQPLLSESFRLTPYQLGYMVMEIEKEFNIDIQESYFLRSEIQTINAFVKIIVQCEIAINSL
jgi:acyl carrier protein